ncbi:sensor histidine kinase [Legionella bononiensis]|uniref:histidine kinase n=1 Tax=Legionella bononiensis TaxID=2793102 RepID=A0ABS1WCW5_9GAMM|nr:HAMP domain-containing sensor histidine kinase [Legionella bononiensis]MBL7479073.1 PAS domain-containing protein [Legionella bononiensis]MBL7527206.1 PAS domain-containing protein [Legionella bononiensis]MBL7562175.1 PAS domain-containing protein [Legionella bononiensis]
MEFHKLLLRQLEKVNISVDKKPETDEQWLAFLKRINNSYNEADQERYMHERSMEISSREMMNLNMKLENAQNIAKLGYWTYDGIADHVIWSKELFFLFKLNPLDKAPTYKEFIELVHKKDRYELVNKIETALSDRIDYECDVRVQNPDGEYRWYKIAGRCCEGEKQLEGIVMDIHNDKIAEEKIQELNNQISSTARRAGMAEVAAIILHNIGNILNSSNVSITLLKNQLNKQYKQKLLKVLEMLLQHEDDLVDYLSNDDKGKLIPKYLVSLSKFILDDYKIKQSEVDNLINDLRHISQIVDMQKSVSGTSSLIEKVYLPEVIDMALNMSMNTPMTESIEIVKEFEECPLIDTDKSKLLQILVNIIQNARDAVLHSTSTHVKEIVIAIKKIDDHVVQLSIKDNGVGINSENLNRIFSFGFTTKINGHGFGLHSAALSAKEMGGTLLAESPGEGEGAQFILSLPTMSCRGLSGGSND